jgi:hypothetical protein
VYVLSEAVADFYRRCARMTGTSPVRLLPEITFVSIESGMRRRAAPHVACQRDGTASLPRVWDHLEVSVSIAGRGLWVNGAARGAVFSLSVGGAFDDEGVGA